MDATHWRPHLSTDDVPAKEGSDVPQQEHALLRRTPPLEIPSPKRRARPARRAPRPPSPRGAGPASLMKLLALDGGARAEWRTLGSSPLAAAHNLLRGARLDEIDGRRLDDAEAPVCSGRCGSRRLFRSANPAENDDDDEGPFRMSPPKPSPRACLCPPADPGG